MYRFGFIRWLKNFKKDDEDNDATSNREILDEVREVKRILRKQGISLDLFKEELLEKIRKDQAAELTPFFDVVEAFFYHETSLRESDPLSAGRREALSILWEKLESLLSSVGIEIIRDEEVDFDPRLYEAVEATGEGEGGLVVGKVLQPGYIHEGKVLRPARAIVRRSHHESLEEA